MKSDVVRTRAVGCEVAVIMGIAIRLSFPLC